MFDDNSVGDSGNRFAFVKTDFGKHGAGRYKEDTFPKAGHDTGKNIAASTEAAQPQPLPPECVSCFWLSYISRPQSDGRMTDLYFFLSEDREGSAVQQHRGLLSEQHRSHLQNARSPQNAGKVVSHAAGAIAAPIFIESVIP